MPTMIKYLPLLAALAGCAAPDTFVLAAIASPDAAPTDVSSDAAGDAPADTAQPDVALADASDAAEATADAADAQVADVALADASDATTDTAVSDAADASADANDATGDAAEASVDEICARARDCAACTAIRFDAAHACGWCGQSGQCMYGTRSADRVGACGGEWRTPWNVCD